MYQFFFFFFFFFSQLSSLLWVGVSVLSTVTEFFFFLGGGGGGGEEGGTVAMAHPMRSDPRDRQPPPDVKVVGTSPSRSTEHDLRTVHATSVLYQQLCGTMSQRTKACVCVSLYVFQCYK